MNKPILVFSFGFDQAEQFNMRQKMCLYLFVCVSFDKSKYRRGGGGNHLFRLVSLTTKAKRIDTRSKPIIANPKAKTIETNTRPKIDFMWKFPPVLIYNPSLSRGKQNIKVRMAED